MFEPLLLNWSDALRQHKPEWEKIVLDHNLNPTLLPDWIDIAAHSHGLADSLQVMLPSSDTQTYGLIPFYTSRATHAGIGFDVVELATNIVSYHAGILCGDDEVRLLQALLERVKPWHMFRASNLPIDSTTLSSLLTLAQNNSLRVHQVPVEDSPYLKIETDWQTFLAHRPKKFRYKYRQRQKQLDENPSLQLKTYSEESDIEVLLPELLAIESNSWKARFGRDIGNRPTEAAYYSRLLPYLQEIGSLHATVLCHEETPISYSLCCYWNNWFGQLKTSFDEHYSELSPGGIVIDASIKAAFDMQAGEFDFLGDKDRHKMSWTKSTRPHCDLIIYSSHLRSRALNGARHIRNLVAAQKRTPSVKPS